MDCSTPGFPVLHHLQEFAQTHVHWVGNAIQTPHPLLSPSRPVFNLSQHQGVFQRVGSSSQVARSFSFNISPSSEYSGLISFRIHWFHLLALQGTLKSLQHHSSKASVLQDSAFFMIWLSHLYMTTGKLTRIRLVFVQCLSSNLVTYMQLECLSSLPIRGKSVLPS